MSTTIDYYFATQSPWSYLGHRRFAAIAKAAGATVRIRPADYGRIFAASGGLPLAKRPPQRQAYRLVELKRFSEHLGLPLHVHPAHFPVAGDDAARLVIAVDLHDGVDAAMTLAERVMRGVWADQRDIAGPATLARLLEEGGLPAARAEAARSAEVQQRYDAHTQHAIDIGVFGAPTYVVEGEPFWGQDRLEFLERRLASG